jgi:hypothetical protein
MRHYRSGDLHVLIVHHCAGFFYFMRVDERRERGMSFIRDVRIDISSAHLQEQTRYLLEGRWSPCIESRVASHNPRQRYQIAVVGVVIRVMVCDENVSQSGYGHAG